MLHKDDQTAEPIGLNFFMDTAPVQATVATAIFDPPELHNYPSCYYG